LLLPVPKLVYTTDAATNEPPFCTYCPSVHIWHAVNPYSDHVPTAQLWHVPVLICPAGHAQYRASVLVSHEICPHWALIPLM
jgi:hypothetical protein